MSQDKNLNNGLSPVREQSNRRVNLGQLSPFQMLRMLMPQEGPSFKDIPIEETNESHDPLQYIPAKRNYESEFYSKFNTIPLRDHNQRAAQDLGPNKFWERKRRHAEMIDNESFVARSSTNYSRLDYKPTPLSRRIHLDDDDDDNRTWRTQDMLSEDGDNAVVLDPQRILELRRTIDEQFIKESLLRSGQRQLESQSQQSGQLPEESSQETGATTTQEPVHDDINLPTITDTQPTDEIRTFSPQPSVHGTMDLGTIHEEINNLPEEPGLNLDDQDWGDDFGQDWSDNELNQIAEEEG
ncbi:hypothetical protein HPULCUR_003458 [Helicostylum pulchrum]|uniref:Uncharacterized protein n=1 Tax=Helicostylum pulchrum TaxID=562976 RepID=A0ABP9XTG0_9FUNG